MTENIVDPAPLGSDLNGSALTPPWRGRSDPIGVRKKFPLLTSILLILLFLVAALAIYLFLQVRILTLGKTVPSPLPTPLASVDPTANWQTYIDPNHLFTFMYPGDWKVGEKNGSYYLIPKSKEDTSKPAIIFNQINNPKKLSIPEYQEELSSEGPSPNMYSKYTVEKKVGGTVGYYREDAGCEPTLCDQFNMSKDNKIYSFYSLYYDLGEDADLSQRAIYNQILSTFKFTNQASSPTITSPKVGSAVNSPLIITGSVPPGWMFEGQFSIEIRDSSNKVVGSGIAQEVEPGSWTNGDSVDFTVTVEFGSSDKSGFIVLLSDNPSGIPEKQLSYKQAINF